MSRLSTKQRRARQRRRGVRIPGTPVRLNLTDPSLRTPITMAWLRAVAVRMEEHYWEALSSYYAAGSMILDGHVSRRS